MDIPPLKKQKTLDSNICIICFQRQTKKHQFVKCPRPEGLESVLNAAETRDDSVHDYISPYRDEILSKEVYVTFHSSCCAKYTSKTNVVSSVSVTRKMKCVDVDTEDEAGAATSSSRTSRSWSSTFNIRRDCFICS